MSQLPPPPDSSQSQPVQPLPYVGPLPVAPPRRPTAVTVIAIIVIVFSSIGVLCSPFGLIPFFMPSAMQQDPVSKAMYGNAAFRVWTIISVIIGWTVSIANLIAAIQALNLKPWARKAMIRIAAIQLVLIVVTLLANAILLLPPLFELGNKDPAMKVGATVGAISAVFGTIFGAVLPSLTIYFFRQQNVIDAFEKPADGAGTMR